MKIIISAYTGFISFLERLLGPVILLYARYTIGVIFLNSGWMKFENFLEGEWLNTVFLFQEVHPVPYISPELAAVLGTGTEIIFPILLIGGMFTRVAAIAIIAIILVMNLTPLIANDPESLETHSYWILALSFFVAKGAGSLSIDDMYVKWKSK